MVIFGATYVTTHPHAWAVRVCAALGTVVLEISKGGFPKLDKTTASEWDDVCACAFP